MKKIVSIMMVVAVLLSGLAFVPKVNVYAASKKPLVISFIHRNNIGDTSDMDIDAISSATVYSGPTSEKKSTVEVIRNTIKKETGGKSFEIKVKKAYSKDYRTTVNRAGKEIDKDADVALKKKKIPNLKKYKTVYLIVPVWHGTLPQPVKVILKKNNFSGKTIYVFGTNLGSGYGDMISSVKKLCPGAKVKKGKTYDGDAKNSSVKKSVKKWLKK